MAETSRTSDLEKIARVLFKHGVEFIVIGGQAETLMGSPRTTHDVDICYERSTANYPRVAAALQELSARLRNVPPEVMFPLDAKTVELGSNFTFDTSIVSFDILGWVDPIGDYAQLVKNARAYPVADMVLKVISLDDLIRVKQHVNRPKDRDSLFQLLAIKRVVTEHGTDDPGKPIA